LTARNILVLTLIYDDRLTKNLNKIWDIQYHLYLEKASYDLLRSQAKKLHRLSSSLDVWQSTEYSVFIKFCDSGTFKAVSAIWDFYAHSIKFEGKGAKIFADAISNAMKTTSKAARQNLFSSMRAMAPVTGVQKIYLADVHYHYWNAGTTNMNGNCEQPTFPNLMYASPDPGLELHYNTNPLLGFHLSAAYPALRPHSYLAPPVNPERPRGTAEAQKLVDYVHEEFYHWCFVFRKMVVDRKVKVRFFQGDCLSFCHALQHLRGTGETSSANLYRDRLHFDKLVLDGRDYGPKVKRARDRAPLSFNVIDTSNLVDHLGHINLFVAAAALLEDTLTSAMYTECITQHEKTMEEFMRNVLCGDFATVAQLVGLVPVEYYTNTSYCNAIEDTLMKLAGKDSKPELSSTQPAVRITWRQPQTMAVPHKRVITAFKDHELAIILSDIYETMFQRENVIHLVSMVNEVNARQTSFPMNNRVTYVAFLRLVKDRVATESWDNTMEILIRLISGISNLLDSFRLQETLLYMDIFGVHTTDMLREDNFTAFRGDKSLGG